MSLLQYRVLNGWPLFFLIAALNFACIIAGLVLIRVSAYLKTRISSTPERSEFL